MSGTVPDMDSITDDVVVVGGRCAGAPTAMLLARAGLSVRLLERSARLGDVVSGHMIKPAGVTLLRRWKLLDAVLATGCPQLEDRVLWLDGQPHRPPVPEPGPGPIAPRRTMLDPILLTAAAQAGADVEMGVSVHGLLREGGRVTGVTTSAGERRARLVIGADGRNSRIARLAGAKIYHDHPPVTFAYYTYWRGSPVAGVQAWLEPGRFFGIFPVGGGLTLAFVQGPRGDYQTFRRDPLRAYVSELQSRPVLAGLLADAVIAEHLRGTAALPTFFRGPSGRGGPWPATPATIRTPPSPGGSPSPSATRTCWPRPSLTAGTATWTRHWPNTGVSATGAPSRSATRTWTSPGWTCRPRRWALPGSR